MNKNFIVMARVVRRRPVHNYVRAVRAVGAAAGVARRAYLSYTRTKKPSNSSSSAVSYQHDIRTDYRRKRMPIKKRKRWVGFVKKVRAVEFKDHASNHVVRAYKSPVFTVTHSGKANQGYQNMTNVGLYGVSTGLEDSTVTGDMLDIWQEWKGKANPTSDGQKLCFTSAVTDIYVTNTGTNTMILDVYESVIKKDLPNTINLFSDSPAAAMPNASATDILLPSNYAGVTPFQLPYYTKYCKILKKTKHVISPGQCITWQHRDPKNHVFKGNDFDVAGGYTMAGKAYLTRIWTLVATGTELCTTNDIAYTLAQSRTYNFKVLDQSQERAGYLLA